MFRQHQHEKAVLLSCKDVYMFRMNLKINIPYLPKEHQFVLHNSDLLVQRLMNNYDNRLALFYKKQITWVQCFPTDPPPCRIEVIVKVQLHFYTTLCAFVVCYRVKFAFLCPTKQLNDSYLHVYQVDGTAKKNSVFMKASTPSYALDGTAGPSAADRTLHPVRKDAYSINVLLKHFLSSCCAYSVKLQFHTVFFEGQNFLYNISLGNIYLRLLEKVIVNFPV